MKIVKFRIGNLTETTLYFNDKKRDYNGELDKVHIRLNKVSKDIDKVFIKLDNDNFISKAPKEIIKKVLNKLSSLLDERNCLLDELNNICKGA